MSPSIFGNKAVSLRCDAQLTLPEEIQAVRLSFLWEGRPIRAVEGRYGHRSRGAFTPKRSSRKEPVNSPSARFFNLI